MTTTPKEKVLEEWDISRLVPYENNAKIHTKEQIKKIAASIKRHGLVNPPNVEPDGTIITGHGRQIALSELGWKTLPVWVRHDLSKSEAAGLRIADNKVAEGQINTSMLQEELRWLEGEMDSLTDLGFDERELAFLTEDIGTLDVAMLSAESLSADDGVSYETSDSMLTKADGATQPVSKSLGFKEITVSDSRALSRFMALLKDKHGDDPKKAFMSFVNEVLSE